MSHYNIQRLGALARQLCLGSRKNRVRQIQAAEQLIRRLDAQQAYGYDEVVLAITGYRTRETAGPGLPGRAVLADVVTLIEDLSVSLHLALAEVTEPILTSEQLAERFDVSLKTISRWRQQGLAARRYIQPETRPILGFDAVHVDWFEKSHPDLIGHGRRFSLMGQEERQEIIELARRLHQAEPDMGLTHLVRRVAGEMGRAQETIRYTLLRYDQEHPQEAIFAERPADAAARQRAGEILYRLQTGESVAQVARQYGLEGEEVRRFAQEERLRRLLAVDLAYLDSVEFKTPGAAVRLLATVLPIARLDQVLSPEEEREGFRQYNFRKLLLSRKLQTLRTGALTEEELTRAEADLAHIIAIRNWLVQCNVRLVVRIARQHVSPGRDFAEAISEGNLTLMRAVDRFDYSRNFRFCTYAGWAIKRSLASHLSTEAVRNRKTFVVENDLLTLNPDLRCLPPEYAADQAGIKVAVSDMLRRLTEREQAVLAENFGLGNNHQRTLEEIGERWGLTKERVRQIKLEALSKLRDMVAERQ